MGEGPKRPTGCDQTLEVKSSSVNHFLPSAIKEAAAAAGEEEEEEAKLIFRDIVRWKKTLHY